MQVHSEFIDDGGRVDWDELARVLRETPSDVRPANVAKRGSFESAAETLVEIARSADDPMLRLKAEQYLTEHGLGAMLVDWSEVPLKDL